MISGVTRNSEAPGQICKSSPPSRFPNLSPVPLFSSPHPHFPSLIFTVTGKLFLLNSFARNSGTLPTLPCTPSLRHCVIVRMVDRRRLLPGVCWPSCLSPVRRTTSQDRYLQFFCAGRFCSQANSARRLYPAERPVTAVVCGCVAVAQLWILLVR